MEKKFCYFLFKIGIIDKETCSTFLHIYKDIFRDNKNINIFELSFQILLTFINNITTRQKEYICQNLPIKFFEIRQKFLQNKLRSIITTNQLKYKMLLIKYLYIWKYSKKPNENKKINNKHNSFIYNRNTTVKNLNTVYQVHRQKNLFEKVTNDITSDDNDYNISSKHIFTNNFLSNKTTTKNTTKNSNSNLNFNFTNINSKGEINKSNSKENTINQTKKNKSFNDSKIFNEIKKSLEYKEEKELEECTFKPKINNLKQNISTTKKSNKERNKEIQNRFEKLYKDNEKYKLSKQIKALELDYLINKNLTFNPSINNTKHLTRENSKENFETRVKKFIAQKKQHSEEIKNQINKEFEQNFSFTPKINTSKISKNNSTHSFFSKTINEKKELENSKDIPAYIRLYEDNKLRNEKQIQKRKEADEFITNLSNSNIKNTIYDINKINELYENKNKSKIEERTRKKVNKEEGVTFKPNLYKNKFVKNIFSNFYERNFKFLEDKEKFITLNKNKISNHEKIISPKEKRQIVNNVIGRLYSDPKSFNLTNIGCNRYIKNIKGNVNKNLNINSFNFQDY